jgi:3-methyladenine DNA glycosylase AlkD
MTKELIEIQKILKAKSNEKVKKSFEKFIPSNQKVYGVKVPQLNELAKRFKGGGFELVEELWKAGAFEEKLLASKILGKICKKDPERTLKFVKRFSKEIKDWAVCDTLATQGIREIAKIKKEEIFALSKKLIKSKNFWERRFAVVLLINFVKEKNLKKDIKDVLKKVERDKEYYIKKAVEWLKRKLT